MNPDTERAAERERLVEGEASATVLDCLESALGEYDAANNLPEYNHDEWLATAVTLCMLVSEHRAELLAALRQCAATPADAAATERGA